MTTLESEYFIKQWTQLWIPSLGDDDIASNKIPSLRMNDLNNELKAMVMYDELDQNHGTATETNIDRYISISKEQGVVVSPRLQKALVNH